MGRRGERGFALLIVLWWVVLLALLGTQLAAAGRLEAGRAGNARAAAAAAAAADGALQAAIFHVLDEKSGWAADGAAHELSVAGGVASVAVRSEAAKVGLNQASAGLLRALLVRLGSPAPEAAALANAIADWRTAAAQRRPLGAKLAEYQAAGLPYAPPNADFESLGELAMVRGMTPALLARLTPLLTLYGGDPDLPLAGEIVRLAAIDAGEADASDADPTDTPAPVMTITIMVRMASGARAQRLAIIRFAPDSSDRPYQLLHLE